MILGNAAQFNLALGVNKLHTPGKKYAWSRLCLTAHKHTQKYTTHLHTENTDALSSENCIHM